MAPGGHKTHCMENIKMKKPSAPEGDSKLAW